MQSMLVSNLNSAFSFGFKRGLTVRKGSNFGLSETLPLIRAHNSAVSYHIVNFRSKRSVPVPSSQRPSSGKISGTFSQGLGLGNRAMASKASCGDVVVDSFKSSPGSRLRSGISRGVYYRNMTPSVCQKACLNLRNGDSKSSGLIGGCLVLGNEGKFSSSDPLIGSWLQTFVTPSSRNYSTGAVPDVSHGASLSEEHFSSLAISDDQRNLSDEELKLLSGACSLPHPDKEATGGEDAHFICEDEQAIGVADGVGGWADVGIDAGIYSRELMSNSVNAIQAFPKNSINPAQVLEKAHAKTKVMGSSTACIIVLRDQDLHAINLGDSGFIVVRDGCTIFESPVQQHGFNFPCQLENGHRGDLPSSGQVFEIRISSGDVIVAGTDGLFDNLYNHEINAVVANGLAGGLSPGETAQKIAALARERALDKKQQTPFSTAAQQAGFTYYGGKLDDITVIVSYISSSVK